MTNRLAPYGAAEYAETISKVGKFKASPRLAARMPSPEIAAKVGGDRTAMGERGQRVVRRNAR